MTQTANDPVNLNAPVCQKYHIDDNVTFNLQAAPFRRVLRTRFFQNVHRRRGAFGARRSFLGRFRGYGLVREAAGLHRAGLLAGRRSCGSIAEACACHRPANSFSASGAVTVAISAREGGGAEAIDIGCVIRVALAGDSVGIAESTCLHFVDRSHNRCGRGAARGHDAHLYVVLRTLRLARLYFHLHWIEFRIQLNRLYIHFFHLGLYGFRCQEHVLLPRIQLRRFRLRH